MTERVVWGRKCGESEQEQVITPQMENTENTEYRKRNCENCFRF